MGTKKSSFAAGIRDWRTPGNGPRRPILLACEKCEHRLAKEGRFRLITQMQHALVSLAAEAEMNDSGLRILPVSCLDVCPRGAMAVAVGAQRGRGPAEIVVVRTPDELRDVCAAMVEDAKAELRVSLDGAGMEKSSVAAPSESHSPEIL